MGNSTDLEKKIVRLIDARSFNSEDLLWWSSVSFPERFRKEIRAWKGEPTSIQVLEVLDSYRELHTSICSPFVVGDLESLYKTVRLLEDALVEYTLVTGTVYGQ